MPVNVEEAESTPFRSLDPHEETAFPEGHDAAAPEHDRDRRERPATPSSGRRLLACASAGGHFKQLVELVGRIPDVGHVTWLTYEQGVSEELVAARGRPDDRLVHTDYAAPRDVVNLTRNARSAWEILESDSFDLAVSTGSGIAVATLPLTLARGIRSVFIESATRLRVPSLSGRILSRVPGIELYAQHPTFPAGWQMIASVHDRFTPGPLRPARLQRVVVTTGTIRPYGFRRLLERLKVVLPADADVLWQTGATDLTGLDIPGRIHVPASELEAAMREADVVIAHAGTGTAVTAFELGVSPVLVPRRREFGEHIDDHQVPTARMLSDRGLATWLEVEQLSRDFLLAASRRTVSRTDDLPPIDL